MLQKVAAARWEWILLVFPIVLTTPACKQETSTHSAETEAYLADYESPTGNKWGFLNTTGILAIEPVYDEVNLFSEGLAAVNQKGKWGYIDQTGKVIIPLLYKSAWAFHEHRARVRPFDSADCFVDTSGTVLSSGEWSAAGDFSEGLALVRVGNSFGYINSTGRMVIHPVYSRGQHFQEGLAIIEMEEKNGVINLRGEIIVPAQFDRITIQSAEQIILCRNDRGSVAFNLTGKELARLENSIMTASDGKLISVKQGSNAFFYNIPGGKKTSSEDFLNLIYLGEHRWAGKQDQGYYLLDQEGKKLNTTAYTQINQFKEGIAVYGRDQGWGYIDLGGKELTGNEFKLAWDYKEGLARAAFEEGIAFIDRRQKIAFYPPAGTMDLRDFSEGLAPVEIAR